MTAASTPSGLVIVDKPAGLTSHDVVARVRRLAGTRKVGHAGTLDPMATGVLVLGVNRATRLLGHLMLTEKSYDAVIRLGSATTTDDAEGEVISSADASDVTDAAIQQALAAFRGEIQQVPTAVSAIKVDGKRAYARIRDGEQVTLTPRPVTIHELVIRDITPATVAEESIRERLETPETLGTPAAVPQREVRISVRCSSGTYIRAIARDLGAALGVGGHLTALRRTSVGPYGIESAHTLDDLTEAFQLLSIAAAARVAFTSVELSLEESAEVRVGRRLNRSLSGLSAVFAPDGTFLALYEPHHHGQARPVAVFV